MDFQFLFELYLLNCPILSTFSHSFNAFFSSSSSIHSDTSRYIEGERVCVSLVIFLPPYSRWKNFHWILFTQTIIRFDSHTKQINAANTQHYYDYWIALETHHAIEISIVIYFQWNMINNFQDTFLTTIALRSKNLCLSN